MQRQTTMAKAQEVKRNWYVVDATNIPLGRLASKIAVILMGKNKPTYTPHVDCGDNVIVINASKVKLTGDAEHKKNYYNVSDYNGRAVWGMLPKGRLGRSISKKLFVYADEKHEQEAQKPVVLDLSK